MTPAESPTGQAFAKMVLELWRAGGANRPWAVHEVVCHAPVIRRLTPSRFRYWLCDVAERRWM